MTSSNKNNRYIKEATLQPIKQQNNNSPSSQNFDQSKDILITRHLCFIFVIAILIFIAPLVCLDTTHHDFNDLAQGLYIQTVCGLMVLLWLLDCLLIKKFEIKRSILYFPIVGILFWSGLSFLWATNISESWGVMYQWMACAVVFFVIYNIVKTPFESSVILFAIMTSMTYLIVIGFLQYFNPNFNFYTQLVVPAATFGNKNMFCDYLIITLPISFYFFINGSDKTRLTLRIISGIVFVGGILVIVLSLTRAPMLAFPILFILFLFFLFLLKRKTPNNNILFSKQKSVLFIVFFVLFIVSLLVLMNTGKTENKMLGLVKKIKSIFVIPEKDKEAFAIINNDRDERTEIESSTIRLIYWKNTLKMIEDRPWQGVGLYNWQIHYGEYRKASFSDSTYRPGSYLQKVHNDYLQILADLGLIGFSLFAWLIITAFIYFKRLFFSQVLDLENKLKVLSLILCIVGFGIQCTFSFLIVCSIPSFLLFIYLALLSNIYYYFKSTLTSNAFHFNYKVAGWFLIPVTIATIYITKITTNRSQADKLYKSLYKNYKDQKFDSALSDGKELLRISPLSYKGYFLIANTYLAIKNYKMAEENIEYGLQFYPNDLDALMQAGMIYSYHLSDYLESKNPDKIEINRIENKIIYWYELALAIRSDLSRALCNLGFMYQKQFVRLSKDGLNLEAEVALKKAELCFDNAMKQDPDYFDVALNKASFLSQTNRGLEASSIALNVLKKSFEQFQKAESEFNDINLKNDQSRDSIESSAKYKETKFQIFLLNAPKAILILKVEYSKIKNFQGLIVACEFEESYLKMQFEKPTYTFQSLTVEMEMINNNSRKLKQGMNKQQFEEIYAKEKKTYELAKYEYNKSLARVYLETSDNFRMLNKNEESISALNKILFLAKTISLPEQESIARLQINAFYLNVINKELIPKIPIIEENFLKATYKENLELNKSKIMLEQKLKEAKQALKVE
jgi:O-antigen ligase